MMRNKKKLLIEQLDQKLSPFQKTELVLLHQKGWINTIRTSLNMTMAQLGAKLNITRQAIKRIEDSEAKGTLSINSLKDVAQALELKFVYGFVPKEGSIDNLINSKAEKLARKIVLRTNHNMKLEDQGISDDKINDSVIDLANEIKREMRKSDKNIVIKWIQISVELKNLLDDTKYWTTNNTFSPEEISIRFKHRIVAINCFPNGNGRHSRMMADIIIECVFGKELFSWHNSNRINADETRKEYITALRNADNGNINPLI